MTRNVVSSILLALLVFLPAALMAEDFAGSEITGRNHGGDSWIITGNSMLAGKHVNISEFKVNSGVLVGIPYLGTLHVRAEEINIWGEINADGRGYWGGYGGEGGDSEREGGHHGDSGDGETVVGQKMYGSAGTNGGKGPGDNCYHGFFDCDLAGFYCGGGGGGGGGGAGYGTDGCKGQNGRNSWKFGGGDCATNVQGIGGAGGSAVTNDAAGTAYLGGGGAGAGGGGAGWFDARSDGSLGGDGGGRIILEATDSLNVWSTGKITANGTRGYSGGDTGWGFLEFGGFCWHLTCMNHFGEGGWGGYGGAGSGGGILLSAPNMYLSKSEVLSAKGGTGKSNGYEDDGAGGAGKIRLYRDSGLFHTFYCGYLTNKDKCHKNVYALDGCIDTDSNGTDEPEIHDNYYVTVEIRKLDDNSLIRSSLAKFSVDEKPFSTNSETMQMLPTRTYRMNTEANLVDIAHFDFMEFRHWTGYSDTSGTNQLWEQTSRSFEMTHTTDLKLVRAYFATGVFFKWVGTVSSDWQNPNNWRVISEADPSGYIPPHPPRQHSATGLNFPVYIPDSTQYGFVCIVQNDGANIPEAVAMIVAEGAEIRWDISNDADLDIEYFLSVYGDFLQYATSGSYSLTIGGDLAVEADATFELAYVDVEVSGNVSFGSNSYVVSDDGSSTFDIIGSTDTEIVNNSEFLILDNLTINKTSQDNVVTLYGNLGAYDVAVTNKQDIDYFYVRSGKLDFNGSSLAVDELLEVSNVGSLYLPFASAGSSTLRVKGRSGGTPLVLSNASGFTGVSLYGDTANIYVGPFYDLDIALPSETSAISIGAHSSVELVNGGRFVIDNRQEEDGWDLVIGNGAKLSAEDVEFNVDRDFIVRTPEELTFTRTSLETGYGISGNGDMVVSTDSAHTSFDRYSRFYLTGDLTTTGSIGGDGGWIIAQGDTTIKSGVTFYKLDVSGDATIDNSGSRQNPIFTNAVDIYAGGELTILPDASLRLLDEATVSVSGTLTAVGTYGHYATLTQGSPDNYYDVVVNSTGTISAKYAIFEYMDTAGLVVSNGATIDSVNDFDNCVFRYSKVDSVSPETSTFNMLTLNNNQELKITGATFISPSATAGGGHLNVQKSLDQGLVLFTDSTCNGSPLGCGTGSDISGEAHDFDEFERVFWSLNDPAYDATNVEVVQAPLNSEKGLIRLFIDTAENPVGTEYCIWDQKTGPNKYANGSWNLDNSSCYWGTYAFWGGEDGFLLAVPDNQDFELRIKARLTLDFTTMSDETLLAGDTNTYDTILFEDRTPPPAPEPLTLSTITSGADDYLSFDWTDVAGATDYILMRGQGGGVGLNDTAAPPARLQPVNGVLDDFSTTRTEWTYTSSPYSYLVDGKLQGNAGGAHFNFDGDGFNLDTTDGYIYSVDVKKFSGTNGVELTIPYLQSAVRWAIGEAVGSSPTVYWSKVYYGTGTLPGGAGTLVDTTTSFGEEYELEVGKWHNAMVYVKGQIARGFIDGVKMWEMEFESVTGDDIAKVNDIGMWLDNTTVLFDNFSVAPMLGLVSMYTDETALDADAPMTPTYTNNGATPMVAATGTNSIQLTVTLPDTPPNSAAPDLDYGTPYFYVALAVDAAGNVSNLLQNPGFEGELNNRGFSIWQDAPSEMLSRNQATMIEGSSSGALGYNGSNAQTIAGQQNVTLPSWMATVDRTGAVLRFSRYYKILNYVAGDMYPAVISVNGTPTAGDIVYPRGTSGEYASDINSWLFVSNIADVSDLPTSVNSVSVYAAPTATSDYDLYFDQNRLDLLKGSVVSEGYSYTQVQYLLESDWLDADKNWAWNNLTELDQGNTTDTGMGENRLRSYRFRTCDARDAAPKNCGPWQGGYTCANVGECPTGYDACNEFGLEKYCVRSLPPTSGGQNGALPGIEVYSHSNIPEAPVVQVWDEDDSSSLKVNLDLNYSTNRAQTDMLVYGFVADQVGECEAGNGERVGFLDGTGILRPLSSAPETYWDITRSLHVAGYEDSSGTEHGLDPNSWYCFRALARNHDGILTSDPNGTDGWMYGWNGWSDLSNAMQPPARPFIVADSLSIKYGVGMNGGVPRAMAVDYDPAQPELGGTVQEAYFTVEDANNLTTPDTYVDVSSIEFRVSPHGIWNGTGIYKSGYFQATTDDYGATWSFSKKYEDQYGNPTVTLLTDQCSVTQDGDQLDVKFAWMLNKAPITANYRPDQDQGVQIQLEDANSLMSYFGNNTMYGCDKVFHTSYLPQSPRLTSPSDDTWVSKSLLSSVDFSFESDFDNDRLYLEDIYNLCTTLGTCVDWGLSGPLNCVDTDGATDHADDVEFQMALYTAVDGNGVCSGSPAAPAAPFWLTKDSPEYSEESNDYKLQQSVNITSLADGVYYWCVKTQDEHNYSSGLRDDPDPVVAPAVTNKLGIDSVKPVMGTLSVDGRSVSEPATVSLVNGEWTFRNYMRFKWFDAEQDPMGLGEDKTAPIKGYHYKLMLRTDASGRVAPSTGGYWVNKHSDPAHEYIVTTIDGSNYWTTVQVPIGVHQFGVQAEDMAGNISDPVWFEMRVDVSTLDAPIIRSDSHPNEDEIYCNHSLSDDGLSVNLDPDAFDPQFEIVHPTVANLREYILEYGADMDLDSTYCNPDADLSQCTGYPWSLAYSGIKSYSFTVNDKRCSGGYPDATPEDDNNPGALSTICDQYMSCTDSDQTGSSWNTQFHFTFDREDSYNIYDMLTYFIKHGPAVKAGSWYFKLMGESLAGATTGCSDYRVNLCYCDGNPPCKDADPNAARMGVGSMAFFGGGRLDTGSLDGSGSDDGSSQEVLVLPFYMDRKEVSNADYQACVTEGVCQALPETLFASNTRPLYYEDETYQDYPVVNVSWDNAQSYCQWVEKRLPYDTEWLYAAQGQVSDADGLSTSFYNDLYEFGDTVSVAEHHGPAVQTDIDPLNLFNNVSEWVQDWWLPLDAVDYVTMPRGPESTEICLQQCEDGAETQQPSENEFSLFNVIREMGFAEDVNEISKSTAACELECARKVVRGGSFLEREIEAGLRQAEAPGAGQINLGFRCAKSAVEFPEAQLGTPEVGTQGSLQLEQASESDIALRP